MGWGVGMGGREGGGIFVVAVEQEAQDGGPMARGGGSSATASLIFSLSHDVHGDYDSIVGSGDNDGSIESKNFKIYLSNFSCQINNPSLDFKKSLSKVAHKSLIYLTSN